MAIDQAGAEHGPWRTIWFRPRSTIRRLVGAEVRPNWVPVFAGAALAHALGMVLQIRSNPQFAGISLVWPVTLVVLLFTYVVFLGPFVLAALGRPLGGKANAPDIRLAVIWSFVPTAVSSVLWLPPLIVFGERLFDPDLMPQSVVELLAFSMFVPIGIAGLWSYINLVLTLSEVQGFSDWWAAASLAVLFVTVMALLLGLQTLNRLGPAFARALSDAGTAGSPSSRARSDRS